MEYALFLPDKQDYLVLSSSITKLSETQEPEILKASAFLRFRGGATRYVVMSSSGGATITESIPTQPRCPLLATALHVSPQVIPT